MSDEHTTGCRDDYKLRAVHFNPIFLCRNFKHGINDKEKIDGENTYANCFVMEVNICNNENKIQENQTILLLYG